MRQPESILNLSGDSWLSHKHYPQHYALYPVLISCVDIHNHVHLHLVPDRDHYNIKKKKTSGHEDTFPSCNYCTHCSFFIVSFCRAAVLTDRLLRTAAQHPARQQRPRLSSAEHCRKENASGENATSSYSIPALISFSPRQNPRVQIREAAEWGMQSSHNMVEYRDLKIIHRSLMQSWQRLMATVSGRNCVNIYNR